MAFSADEHGWSAGAFHAQVDTFGAAVVLGTTAGGATFGAYNPRGWIGEQWKVIVRESSSTLLLSRAKLSEGVVNFH